MAEIRNTFVKSKMNKDLDDRLLGNGEYREGQNVNISRSEGEDVGALENVLGNIELSNFGLASIPNLEIIGHLSNDIENVSYFLATNYTDTSSDELSNPAPYGAACYILMFNYITNTSSILVQGRFLNFSKTQPIYGIDLIEELLFWTDDRNQPRKINVKKAIADNTYYTTEDQISVAKYFPYEVPLLYDSVVITGVTTNPATGNTIHFCADATDLRIGMTINVPTVNDFPIIISNVNYTTNSFLTLIAVSLGTTASPGTHSCEFATSQNTVDRYTTPSFSGEFVSVAASAGGSTIKFTKACANATISLNQNMGVSCAAWEAIGNPGSVPIETLNAATLFSGSLGDATAVYEISVNVDLTDASFQFSTLVAGDILFFADPNPNFNSSWPGDKDYLEDKFVRFAYRFKFDDGEYSLISPFTQPAFIPKQDGYLRSIGVLATSTTNATPAVETTTRGYLLPSGQEANIRSSTIVNWFENKVQQVKLRIPMPFIVNQLAAKLKVSEIEILYKESDGLAIQVVNTMPITDTTITGNSTNIYEYVYQSTRPFKTLPEKEVSRVFDKVPIRAMSQSSVGNRIVYGNFLDKHTPPSEINYRVAVSPKTPISQSGLFYSTLTTSHGIVSYPNHSVKQNRNYQIGIVLADRYGRQSDVILQPVSTNQTKQTGNTLLFNGSTVYHPYRRNSQGGHASIRAGNWPGDSIKVLFVEAINALPDNTTGYPGIYKSGEYTVTASVSVNDNTLTSATTIDKDVSPGDLININGNIRPIISIDSIGTNARRKITYGGVSVSVVASTVYNIHGPENKLGWYTYKIVVKQLKHEYYNVYLPCLISAKPNLTAASKTSNNSYSTLYSDNINKIPSELEEVQPEQTQFGTNKSLLFPIVTNEFDYNVQAPNPNNFMTADIIGKIKDLDLNTKGPNKTSPNNQPEIEARGLYNATANPNAVEFSTYGEFRGTNPNDGRPTAPYIQDPGAPGGISILETDPVESRIEIFYETSTSGLVSELNDLIASGVAASEVAPDPPAATE